MPSAVARNRALLAVVSSIIYALGFPIVSLLVDGGEFFGSFVIIPLAIIAWNWGTRRGLAAAMVGIVYGEAIYLPEYFLVHHRPFSAYFVMVAVVPALVFLFFVLLVGKLRDSRRELDLTQRAKENAESALRLTEEKYRNLVENGSEGIVVVQDQRLVFANSNLQAKSGISAEELKMKSFIELVFPEDRLKAIDCYAKVMSGKETSTRVSLRLVDKDNGVRWTETTASAIAWEGKPAVLCFLNDRTDQKQAEIALADRNAHYEAVLDALTDVMYELDRNGRLFDFRAAHPVPPLFPLESSPIGKTIHELLPAEAARTVMGYVDLAAEKGEFTSPAYSKAINGKTRWFELLISAIGDHKDPLCHFIALQRDITDRKTLEQQLLQAQKMEAVGRLAGGIAHDFNNILLVILGFCELISDHPGDQDKVLEEIGVIRDSANRAASLTKQLLAFSRKQLLQLRVLDVLSLIQEMKDMLTRTLGEDVELQVVAAPEAMMVRADKGQLQQVIMNLAVNARDAMPRGGRLTIEVQRVEMADEDPQKPSEVIPGEYVRISVHDTGSGMDQEIMSHLFEPFFTTKEAGKGTGLGLSIVYGIIKQSEGYIYAESKVGVGTTFRIYLRRVFEEPERKPAHVEEERTGTETILLVEDEESVRKLLHLHLTRFGYKVLEASNGAEALSICRAQRGRIHLLLTDVILPGVRGVQVADAFKDLNPGAPVIFMTGYTDSSDLGAEPSGRLPLVLHKPFGPKELLAQVRKALRSHASS